MAFLDNSRDIIIDAVLTDLGRLRLAQGQFSIQRFALGDDEINYGLYNSATGSAYVDLEILQTPVFEAFTNNISTMNSKLVTYTGQDLLHLPIIKLNTLGGGGVDVRSSIENSNITIRAGLGLTTITGIENVFAVAVDTNTVTSLTNAGARFVDGSKIINDSYVRLDQGIDVNVNGVGTSDILASELVEDQYTVEIDNRFGFLSFGESKLQPTFIDDDDVALYTFSRFNADVPAVVKLAVYSNTINDSSRTGTVVAGARGTALRFGVYANPFLSQDSTSTNTLFSSFGVSLTYGGSSYKIIHTTVTITGLKTGYSIDVPVSFIRKV